MRRKIPPLNALHAFEVAARLGGFTRAAEELSVAQPAVTRHIANIENWIGTPLFHRQGNMLELTREGRLLSMLATSTFDRLELGIRDIARANHKELVVGASFGVAHLWVMPRISGMRAASNMNINLVTADDYQAFDAPDVDFSIRFGNGDFGDNEADLLFEEQCHIIAAPALLEKHPELDPEHLAKMVKSRLMLDHCDPHGIGWMSWQLWHELMNIPFPGNHRLTQVQSYPTMLDMVCAGEGISIGTLCIEDDLVNSGKLLRLGTSVAREGFGYFLVYKSKLRNNLAFERLRSYLLSEFTHK